MPSRDFPEFTKAHCEALYYELWAERELVIQYQDRLQEDLAWYEARVVPRRDKAYRMMIGATVFNVASALWNLLT